MQMSPASENPTLSDRAFDKLRTIIRERTGISFPDEKRYLMESRVRSRLEARDMADYDAYVRYLSEENDPREITQLVNAVTINETSFFRHPAQFDALGQTLLPEVIEQRRQEGTRRVRLWSAACSTGEEAYSLAILVQERIQPRFPDVKFQIVATDVDTDALTAARTGHYGARAVRNVPTAYLHKLFRRSGDTYVLRSSVRDMVTFQSLNLVNKRSMKRMRNFDVIMCANVLIYFDAPKKQQVLKALHGSLRPGGYLLVGGSETLGETDVPFEPIRDLSALVYQRPRAGSTAPAAG